MRSVGTIIRFVACLLLASVVCIAVFGLSLALLQSLPGNDAILHKLVSTIASAAIAITSGGFVDALAIRSAKVAHAAFFGLLFGGLSFGYIFGVSWQVIPSTALSVLLAAAGGMIAERLPAKRGRPAASTAA